jgi:hypothetical protein
VRHLAVYCSEENPFGALFSRYPFPGRARTLNNLGWYSRDRSRIGGKRPLSCRPTRDSGRLEPSRAQPFAFNAEQKKISGRGPGLAGMIAERPRRKRPDSGIAIGPRGDCAHGARQTEKSYHGVGGSVEENRIFTLTKLDATNHALGADTRDTGAGTGETGTRGDQARDS